MNKTIGLLIATACLAAAALIVLSSEDGEPEPLVRTAGTQADGEPVPPAPRYSGDWVLRNGVRVCDGYLTRREDEDFCVPEVPEDWVPFEFDGETYYMAPLSTEAAANATAAVNAEAAEYFVYFGSFGDSLSAFQYSLSLALDDVEATRATNGRYVVVTGAMSRDAADELAEKHGGRVLTQGTLDAMLQRR